MLARDWLRGCRGLRGTVLPSHAVSRCDMGPASSCVMLLLCRPPRHQSIQHRRMGRGWGDAVTKGRKAQAKLSPELPAACIIPHLPTSLLGDMPMELESSGLGSSSKTPCVCRGEGPVGRPGGKGKGSKGRFPTAVWRLSTYGPH